MAINFRRLRKPFVLRSAGWTKLTGILGNGRWFVHAIDEDADDAEIRSAPAMKDRQGDVDAETLEFDQVHPNESFGFGCKVNLYH